jgi:hypothetical protein
MFVKGRQDETFKNQVAPNPEQVEESQYPELEGDRTRMSILASVLNEFPSIRRETIKWLKTKYPP